MKTLAIIYSPVIHMESDIGTQAIEKLQELNNILDDLIRRQDDEKQS